MKSLNQYISQVKDLHSLNEYISEQLSDVKTHWHPKKDLFTINDPQEIVDYLMKNSKDQAQAMQRLCFYINRAGDNLSNKTVLNKAKQLLKKEKVDEKLIVNKNFKSPHDDKCLLIYTLVWNKNTPNNNNEDQVMLVGGIDCKVEDDKITLNLTSQNKEKLILKRVDDYYFWKTENNVLCIYLVGLDYYDSIDFLNKISKNIPKRMNVHDYYSASPDNECEFKFYDDKTQKYKHYTKKDIEKLIKDLKK